jgi:hypothetical protein
MSGGRGLHSWKFKRQELSKDISFESPTNSLAAVFLSTRLTVDFSENKLCSFQFERAPTKPFVQMINYDLNDVKGVATRIKFRSFESSGCRVATRRH